MQKVTKVSFNYFLENRAANVIEKIIYNNGII